MITRIEKGIYSNGAKYEVRIRHRQTYYFKGGFKTLKEAQTARNKMVKTGKQLPKRKYAKKTSPKTSGKLTLLHGVPTLVEFR